MALDLSVRQHIETVIVACLALFVRSSAGHLARYHHGLHRPPQGADRDIDLPQSGSAPCSLR
ncbi:MAG: hypothetical protein IPL60_14735 [Ardenticatenia bacterium]|nr:hypothetical protein [Ardenticatenia bacterium]